MSTQMTSLMTQFSAPVTTVLLPQQMITYGTTRNCLRIRGLPMEAAVADILCILGDCSRHVALQGVHIIYSQAASISHRHISTNQTPTLDILALPGA